MTDELSCSTHRDVIRDLLEAWAMTTRLEQKDQILANHAPDAMIFDVLPPLKYESTSAYCKSWDEWQPKTEGPGIFEFHDLKITASNEVAFAYGLIRCGGTKSDGKVFEDWVRATFCLCNLDGRWVITHQHISMPFR
ncbi:MAG: nuclear transport factor 2 family protein [Cyanobacteria bacterium J06626_14]